MFTARQLDFLLTQQPNACAQIYGNLSHPNLRGLANFYRVSSGIILIIQVTGLPLKVGICTSPLFELHIHEGSECTGNMLDPFANAGSFYNPNRCAYPNHAGQLPPLYGTDGKAFMLTLINGFTLEEIIGRTIIIYELPREFAAIPFSSIKIGCGEIVEGSQCAASISL